MPTRLHVFGLELDERRVVERKTEAVRHGDVKRRLSTGHGFSDDRRNKHLHVYTVRTAEAVVNVRGRLGRRAFCRSAAKRR
jgi:hypothetical protein